MRYTHVIPILPDLTVFLAISSGALLAIAPVQHAFAATSGTWSPVGSLHAARDGHTATLLTSGEVVVAGGEGNAGATSATDVYSPLTLLWKGSGKLIFARASHQAVLLNSGSILVAGGCIGNCLRSETPTAEIYNPISGTWLSTGKLNVGRLEHAAVLFNNGKVLVSGGNRVTVNNTGVVPTAELYDPASGAWTLTGNMTTRRVGHSSTLLQSGRVLTAGGSTTTGELASAETFQP